MATFKPKYYARKESGRITFVDPEQIRGFLSKFDDGQELELTIEKRRRRRTSGKPGEETNFNGYYWKCLVQPIAEHYGEIGREGINRTHALIQLETGNYKKYGEDSNISHEWKRSPKWLKGLIGHFIPSLEELIEKRFLGAILVPLGTSEMTGSEFSEYCSRVRIWANQVLGLYLPEPHEAVF